MIGYSSLTDNELADLIKKGDVAAFTQLYNQYSVQMYCNALKMVKDESVAEEIVQDIFARIWQKRDTINFDVNIAAYLYRVGQNLVYDFFRKLQRDKVMYDHFKAVATEQYSHIEEALHYQESEMVLQKAMSVLSPQQKKVYQLCKLDGCSYKEAAVIIGISPHTVKEYLAKANQLVKAYLLSNLDSTLCIMMYIMFKHSSRIN